MGTPTYGNAVLNVILVAVAVDVGQYPHSVHSGFVEERMELAPAGTRETREEKVSE